MWVYTGRDQDSMIMFGSVHMEPRPRLMQISIGSVHILSVSVSVSVSGSVNELLKINHSGITNIHSIVQKIWAHLRTFYLLCLGGHLFVKQTMN